ncbi:hypothetical protein [Rubritalea squalenifaciens]|uniref:hypothetical protein n=1 Tax=Rubritalea squalenifaciens TaxID=407226 RepID=UPI0011614C9A|nr:hypothetical protein [Rubritalea squalenifaciens]
MKYLLAAALGSLVTLLAISAFQKPKIETPTQPAEIPTATISKDSPDGRYHLSVCYTEETLSDGSTTHYNRFTLTEKSTGRILESLKEPAYLSPDSPQWSPSYLYWSPESTTVIVGTFPLFRSEKPYTAIYAHDIEYYHSRFDEPLDEYIGLSAGNDPFTDLAENKPSDDDNEKIPVEEPKRYTGDFIKLPGLLEESPSHTTITVHMGFPRNYYATIDPPIDFSLPRYGHTYFRRHHVDLNEQDQQTLVQVLTNPDSYLPHPGTFGEENYFPEFAVQLQSPQSCLEISLALGQGEARIAHNGKETHYTRLQPAAVDKLKVLLIPHHQVDGLFEEE